jgi:hypothetical protein
MAAPPVQPLDEFHHFKGCVMRGTPSDKTMSQGLVARPMLHGGQNVLPALPEGWLFHNMPQLKLCHNRGVISVDPASGAAVLTNMWFHPTTGNVSHISMQLTRFLVKAGIVATGVNILTCDARCVAGPVTFIDYYAQTAIPKNRFPPTRCRMKSHKAVYPDQIHPDAEFLIGFPGMCTSCFRATFTTPPGNWMPISQLSSIMNHNAITDLIAPLKNNPVRPVLIGAIAHALMYPREQGTMQQMYGLGNAFINDPIRMIIHIWGGTNNTIPLHSAFGPRVWRQCKRLISARFHGLRNTCKWGEGTLRSFEYFGWVTSPLESSTSGALCGEAGGPAPFVVWKKRHGSRTHKIMMDAHMHAVLVLIGKGQGPSVDFCAVDYETTEPGAYDAKSDHPPNADNVRDGVLLVKNAEYVPPSCSHRHA